MPNLRDRITNALNSPMVDSQSIDPIEKLTNLLAITGHRIEDSGGTIQFIGRDPILSGPWPLATVGGVAMMAKSIAMADIWRFRTGEGQDIAVDLRKIPHRMCPFYDRKWELLNGFAPGMPSDPHNPFSPLIMYRTSDDRWIQLANVYPKSRMAALKLMGTSDGKAEICSAISKWRGMDLENEANSLGIQATLIRTIEEFMQEEQFAALEAMDLVSIEKIGDSDPIGFSKEPSQPLDGVRALGLSHVIAGPGLGRALALHGADVLNVWRPTDFEFDFLYYTSNVGMRSTTIDLDATAGHSRFLALLKDADVFFCNRRPGFTKRYGLTAEEAACHRPGIIHVAMSLYGASGPWSTRTGFDQNAGGATGILALEGTRDHPQLPEIKVVNDYVTSWIASVAVAAALKRRAQHGGSFRIEISLARVSLWLMEFGIFDKRFSAAKSNSSEDHAYLSPDFFTVDTPCGAYQGVTDQVIMSRTPGAYRVPLVPRGSCPPEWMA